MNPRDTSSDIIFGDGFEKIDFRFDIEKLRQHLEVVKSQYAPSMPTPEFGGWSVLSKTGEVTDGWTLGHQAFVRDDAGGFAFDAEKAKEVKVDPLISNFKVQTPICYGYLKEVMEKIEAFGLNPRRARICLIEPGQATAFHVDGAKTSYGIRLHIPIVTNSECAFEYEDRKLHMPADGNGYIVRVTRPHCAYNRGTEPRYHLLMDAYDFTGVTRFHRWKKGVERLPTWIR